MHIRAFLAHDFVQHSKRNSWYKYLTDNKRAFHQDPERRLAATDHFEDIFPSPLDSNAAEHGHGRFNRALGPEGHSRFTGHARCTVLAGMDCQDNVLCYLGICLDGERRHGTAFHGGCHGNCEPFQLCQRWTWKQLRAALKLVTFVWRDWLSRRKNWISLKRE